jgi:hypothetical protein
MTQEKKAKLQLNVSDLNPAKDAKGGVGRMSRSSTKQPMPRMNG